MAGEQTFLYLAQTMPSDALTSITTKDAQKTIAQQNIYWVERQEENRFLPMRLKYSGTYYCSAQ
jgi:hypothetical protein